jgi:uncharacterized membrane protein YfcA
MPLTPIDLAVAAASFVAAFTQALTGFGSALVGMPLLSPVVGVRIASPLMAVISILLNLSLLVIRRQSVRWQAMWQLILAAVAGIPIGLVALSLASEQIVLVVLGIILIAYSLYAWFTPRLPELAHPAWKYIFGFVSGVLAGAYNVGGPPAVIYASAKGWEPNEFKSNLQALFVVENVVVVVGHGYTGSFTPEVLNLVLVAIPALILGIVAGLALARYIPDALFRKLVLILLIVLGVRLVLG